MMYEGEFETTTMSQVQWRGECVLTLERSWPTRPTHVPAHTRG